MLGKVFGAFLVLAFGFAAATGRMEETAAAALSGGEKAVTLVLSLLGVTALWGGIARVLDTVGAGRFLERMLSPLLRRLFPDAARKGKGLKEISASVCANLLGLGNASTPLALAAMRALRENKERDDGIASDDMVTFTVLGTASPSLLPTTLLALRAAAGAKDPFSILPWVWLCSFVTAAAGILFARLFARKGGK